VWTVALLALLWLAWRLRDLLMLLGFAVLLAYALDPIVSWIERIRVFKGRQVPRGVAAGLVILAVALIAGWALASATPRLIREITNFAASAPGALARVQQSIERFVESRGWGGLLGTGSPGSVASLLLHTAQQWSMALLRGVLGNAGQLAGLLLLPVLAFYLLAERQAIQSSVQSFVPKDLQPQIARLLRAADPALRSYVRGQSLVCLAMGTSVGFILQLLGFPVALLLGVIVGLAEIIPFIGFWIAATTIGLAGYAVRPELALVGIGAYAVVNNLMGYFVTPRLLGREVKMHPFVVTVSILAGGALLGPAGSILALPLAAMTQAVIAEFASESEDGSAT
jgi:predicted PurR-regulated permease PerM